MPSTMTYIIENKKHAQHCATCTCNKSPERDLERSLRGSASYRKPQLNIHYRSADGRSALYTQDDIQKHNPELLDTVYTALDTLVTALAEMYDNGLGERSLPEKPTAHRPVGKTYGLN